jgi:acyl carrier protein
MSVISTREHVRDTILEVLGEIAPEVDLSALDDKLEFRDQIDLDSMDYLNLVIGVHERLGVDIPEEDYADLVTLDGFVDYVIRRIPAN